MTPEPSRPIVLIVEDEPLVREIASEEFREQGYEVVEAEDGSTAVEVLASGRHLDLLFTDIRLPGQMDGWSIAEAARVHRPAIPVIYATGFSAESLRMVKGGLFFKKPYRLSAVLAAAAELRAA